MSGTISDRKHWKTWVDRFRACAATLDLFFVLILIAQPGLAQDATGLGDAAGRNALSKIGSLKGIHKLVDPLVGGSSQMTTIDGSQSFTSRLSCPSSAQFLDVLIVPSATGDLSHLIIGQDADLNGTPDVSYQVPFRVSGICGNGIISCDAGSWNHCQYFRWTATNAGLAGLEEVSANALGGCFCINGSCGNNLVFSNLSSVLTTLGGGIVGALQGVNPKYAISDVRIDGTAITYFGQNTAACTASTSAPSNEQYFNNPSGIAAALQSEMASQTADPSSTFQLLTTSPAAQDQTVERRQCMINRFAGVSAVNTFCQHPPPGGSLTSREQTTILKVFAGTFRNINNCDCNNVSGYCTPPGAAVYGAVPDGAIYLGTSAEDFRDRSQRRGDDRCTYDAYDYYSLCVRTSDVFTETVTDNCSGLSADPKCRLMEETVDTVSTYYSFNPTNLQPLDSCTTFNGAVASYNICRAWWDKNRIYQCETGNGVDFTDAKQRMATVTQNVTDQNSSVSFQDLRKDASGNWINENHTFAAPARTTFAGCETACKTRRAIEDTEAGVAGHTGQFRTSTQSYEFFYKSCMSNGCPVGPGEEILKDCQCIDDFAEAATLMSALQSAGEEMICSSGVKR